MRQHHRPDIMSMSTEKNPTHAILAEMGALGEAQLGRERFFKIETLQKNFFQAAQFWAGSRPETRKAALAEVRKRIPPAAGTCRRKRPTSGMAGWTNTAKAQPLNALGDTITIQWNRIESRMPIRSVMTERGKGRIDGRFPTVDRPA